MPRSRDFISRPSAKHRDKLPVCRNCTTASQCQRAGSQPGSARRRSATGRPPTPSTAARGAGGLGLRPELPGRRRLAEGRPCELRPLITGTQATGLRTMDELRNGYQGRDPPAPGPSRTGTSSFESVTKLYGPLAAAHRSTGMVARSTHGPEVSEPALSGGRWH